MRRIVTILFNRWRKSNVTFVIFLTKVWFSARKVNFFKCYSFRHSVAWV